MRVIHVSVCCHHDSIGGMQRFQRDLIVELDRLGVPGSLLWLTDDPPLAVRDDVPVIAVPSGGGASDPDSDAEALLDDGPPSLIHFHSFGVREARLARLAREQGVPYVFTYHAPTALCPNTTLLRWGTTPCDGEVVPTRCGACRPVSWLRTPHPRGAHRLPVLANVRSGLKRRRSLRGHPGVVRFGEIVREFLAACPLVFVPADRYAAVLTVNGAPPDALRPCPPGVSEDGVAAPPSGSAIAGSRAAPCVVGYVGRIDPFKGLHVLLEGFMGTRWSGARLWVVGQAEDTPRARAYAAEVQAVAAADSRVSFTGARPVGELAALYEGLTLIGIPSIGFETGPLVLLEALAQGVFPLASGRVGQLDLARRHGTLVDPNTPAEWTRTLEGHFERFRAGEAPFDGARPVPPTGLRTMRQVAGDVLAGYESVLGAPARVAVG